MSPIGMLELAAASFVGSHFVLSHPLRKPLVKAMGEKGFLGFYSLVAFATLGWMVWASWQVGPESPMSTLGTAGWIVASLLVWLGSILFVGSHKGNPALPHPDEAMKPVKDPWGVFRITRHPMMWGFALWGIGHAMVNSTPSGLIVSEAIIVLALVGALLQDMKKRRRHGKVWRDWLDRTSFLPFGRGLRSPGTMALVGGTILFLVATFAHGALGYRPAGPWAFLG
jgi:uncharacterized membrane protein